MAIDISNFVDVNIQHHVNQLKESKFDIIGLVKSGADNNTYRMDNSDDVASLKEKLGDTSAQSKWLDVFCENGGHAIQFADSNVKLDSNVMCYVTFDNLNEIKLTDDSICECTGDNVSAVVCAYLSTIDFNVADSVKDVEFTQVIENSGKVAKQNSTIADSTYAAEIAGIGYILGGFVKDTTYTIVNEFARNCMIQLIRETVFNVLASKIRVDNAGIRAVKNAVSRVLTKFVNNGYISTNKMWADADLYNGNELIVAHNAPLANGYVVYTDPISADNIKEKTLPTIYILYGDQVGVRKIVVTGEVF